MKLSNKFEVHSFTRFRDMAEVMPNFTLATPLPEILYHILAGRAKTKRCTKVKVAIIIGFGDKTRGMPNFTRVTCKHIL